MAIGHLTDIGAWMQEVAIQEGGTQLLGDGAGDGGLTAAGNAHQNKDVFLLLAFAHAVFPGWRQGAAQSMLLVTVMGNILW
ncbi:hypothetical protein EDWATA_03582 [Edwardsiella tarda ATCC 23685]|uniref:Uncharacterized protein n=1 Tax=Edwardsiella tarda ATCC 23685 TaxID=500638 RepID=D4F9W8_EDWTA|nr:hypothetical protein EDWATA_03582 [Edwardsiella tarda ATCC 23685]